MIGNGRGVIVVGGGLAGLAAATWLARGGRAVTLLERARSLGGRAATQEREGFHLNLGPHALYRAGAAAAALRELGVTWTGGVPRTDGAYLVDRRGAHTLPAGPLSLLATGYFGVGAKLEAARLLGALPRIVPSSLGELTVREWLDRTTRRQPVRDFLAAIVRLSTYANDPERQSAAAALAQVQLGFEANVEYVDGGWQALVDGLRERATAAGVAIETGARVAAVEHDASVRAVRLADGGRREAEAVVLALAPEEAKALAPEVPALAEWARAAIPVRAACLCVALSRLPRPRARFALGVEPPVYASVHSAVARLAPAGGALIHAAKYLGPHASDPASDERELEALLDTLQPGWRESVVVRRFLPHLVVSNALVTRARDGRPDRPGPEVPGVRGLVVAGDWVGGEGMLADASLASARRAAEHVLTRAPERQTIAS